MSFSNDIRARTRVKLYISEAWTLNTLGNISDMSDPRGGGLIYETDGDARRLA